MRYVSDLMDEVRRDANDAGSTKSVTDADVVRFIQWGHEALWGKILQAHPKAFRKTVEVQAVANQEEYVLNVPLYLGTRVVNVEFSPTGQTRDYYKIGEKAYSYYSPDPESTPTSYIRRNNAILPNPPISSSTPKLRVTYEKAPHALRLRAGQIDAVTDTGTQVTAITLDTTGDDLLAAVTAFPIYLCVSSPDGENNMNNIQITGYDSGTGVVTLSPHTYASGETIAVDDYVTIGAYTITHPELPTDVERCVQTYATWKILSRDTATEEKAGRFEKDYLDMMREIIASYQEADKEEDDVQISNEGLLLGDC